MPGNFEDLVNVQAESMSYYQPQLRRIKYKSIATCLGLLRQHQRVRHRKFVLVNRNWSGTLQAGKDLVARSQSAVRIENTPKRSDIQPTIETQVARKHETHLRAQELKAPSFFMIDGPRPSRH